MKLGIRGALACAALVLAGVVSAQTVSFADLARQTQYDRVKISPDGKYLAATSVIKDTPVLTLVELATSKGVNVYPREGNQVVDFDWVNDHRLIYTVGLKVAGFDQPFSTGELFAVNADGGGAMLLFGYRAGDGRPIATHIQRRTSERASGALIDTLRDDPDHVLISVDSWGGGAEGAFTEAYKMDVRDGTKHLLTRAPLRNAQFLADHHGVVRFAFGNDSQSYNKVYYRAADDAPWELLSSEDGKHGAELPVIFSRDDSKVYMSCAAPGAVQALCAWDTASHTMQAPLWSSATDGASGLLTSLDGLDVVGVQSMPGLPSTAVLDAQADAIRLLAKLAPSFPGEDVRIASSSLDGSKVVVLVHSDIHPGAFYLWDAATQKAHLLLERASWINPDAMAATQAVTFKARDGLTLHGYLSMPPGKEQAKHLPLVVYVHGGPFGVRDDWGYDPYVQMLATHGYAVLQVNYRGSAGYGYRFQRAGYGEWGGAMQDDLTDATQWAIDEGITQAGHVCIFGGSYGGYAALEGAVKEPDLYRCAIGYVGVYDLGLMYGSGDIPQSTSGKNYLRQVLGDDPAALAARSPVNQLDRLKAQVMLIVGGADQRVPSVQGSSLHNAMLKRGIAHEWLYKDDEGHGFYNEANRAELFSRVVSFLDHQIGSTGDGGKVAQGR